MVKLVARWKYLSGDTDGRRLLQLRSDTLEDYNALAGAALLCRHFSNPHALNHSLLCDSTAEAQYRVQGFASCHRLNKNITRLTIKLWPLNECSTRITSVNFDPSN